MAPSPTFDNNSDGKVRDCKVLRGLGYGLTERAIEATTNWEFHAGRYSEQAVAVRATIEITFNLR